MGAHGGSYRRKRGPSGGLGRLGGPRPSQGPRATALRGMPGRPPNQGSEAIFLGISCDKLEGDAFRLGIRVIFLCALGGVNVAAAQALVMIFYDRRS